MTTISDKARKRARESRLRAIIHIMEDGTRYYTVYNLRDKRRYVVGKVGQFWVCHCEASKAGSRCKHLQRVLDREEARTKSEALTDG